MGIAVGSCTQISLFVVPLTVISGWVMDKDMTLNFPHFESKSYNMVVKNYVPMLVPDINIFPPSAFQLSCTSFQFSQCR